MYLCVSWWSWAAPVRGSFDPRGGRGPQVENCCPKSSHHDRFGVEKLGHTSPSEPCMMRLCQITIFNWGCLMVIPGSLACGSEKRPAEELAWFLPESRVAEYWSGITDIIQISHLKEACPGVSSPDLATQDSCLTNCKLQITTGRGLRTSA